MKKFLTALIAFVMCFSVVTTAFAATPDEISESDVASEIRQVMIDTYYGGKEPEYLNIEIVGSTSDGGVCFMHNEGFSLDYSIEETIGDYTYHYNHNDDVKNFFIFISSPFIYSIWIMVNATDIRFTSLNH